MFLHLVNHYNGGSDFKVNVSLGLSSYSQANFRSIGLRRCTSMERSSCSQDDSMTWFRRSWSKIASISTDEFMFGIVGLLRAGVKAMFMSGVVPDIRVFLHRLRYYSCSLSAHWHWARIKISYIDANNMIATPFGVGCRRYEDQEGGSVWSVFLLVLLQLPIRLLVRLRLRLASDASICGNWQENDHVTAGVAKKT